MAKKTKAEIFGGIIAIVLIIAVLIFMVCVALLPLVFVVGTIYCRLRFTRIKNGLKNHLSDFWLNDEEKKEFKSKSMNRKEYAEIIADAEKEAEEAGICRNNDGRYSTRSNLGNKIRKIYDDYPPIIKEIDERLQELQERPLKKWKSFNSIASNSKAFPAALFIWFVIILYYLSSAYKQGVVELNPNAMLLYLGSALGEVFMCVITFGGSETAKIYQSFQMIGYSFGGAIISFLIFKGILSNYGSKFSPKPPKVTMENVDLQNVSDDIFNG